MKLQWVGLRTAAAQFAICLVDLGSAARIAPFAVRMMLFDKPFVRLLDSRSVGAGREPESGECGSAAGHRRPSNPLFGDMKSGASDGARTRDLRRDRPAL